MCKFSIEILVKKTQRKFIKKSCKLRNFPYNFHLPCSAQHHQCFLQLFYIKSTTEI